MLLALNQFGFFRSIFKSLFNLFKDLLMIRRFVVNFAMFYCYINTVDNRNIKGPKKDSCGTPHICNTWSTWCRVFDWDKLLTVCQMIQTTCLQIHVFHNDIITPQNGMIHSIKILLKVNKNTTCKVTIIKSLHQDNLLLSMMQKFLVMKQYFICICYFILGNIYFLFCSNIEWCLKFWWSCAPDLLWITYASDYQTVWIPNMLATYNVPS